MIKVESIALLGNGMVDMGDSGGGSGRGGSRDGGGTSGTFLNSIIRCMFFIVATSIFLTS